MLLILTFPAVVKILSHNRLRRQQHHPGPPHRRGLHRTMQVNFLHQKSRLLRWLFVGAWAKAWMSEFNLIYPACANCVDEMRSHEPVSIYKHHKLGKLLLDTKVEARLAIEAAREKNSNKIAFGVSRDL